MRGGPALIQAEVFRCHLFDKDTMNQHSGGHRAVLLGLNMRPRRRLLYGGIDADRCGAAPGTAVRFCIVLEYVVL